MCHHVLYEIYQIKVSQKREIVKFRGRGTPYLQDREKYCIIKSNNVGGAERGYPAMEQRRHFEVTSLALHVMAMLFMLCDHLWAVVVPGQNWMTCVGRIAFPLFAFLIVEGYFHTSSLKRYVGRLLLFAVLSEIPFNLVMGSSILYPLHQNVLWTFLISIGLIWLNEKARQTGRLWVWILVGVGTVLLGYILGIITMVDFQCGGVLTVLTFYFFRGRKWWNFLGQLVLLAYINLEMLGGLAYEVRLFGGIFYIAQQGFALLALLPIWLYRGKQGPHSKLLQYACYAFYPVHLLALGLIQVLS